MGPHPTPLPAAARGGDVQYRGGEVGCGLTRAGRRVGQEHAALPEGLLNRAGEPELLGTIIVAHLARREGTGVGEDCREPGGVWGRRRLFLVCHLGMPPRATRKTAYSTTTGSAKHI